FCSSLISKSLLYHVPSQLPYIGFGKIMYFLPNSSLCFCTNFSRSSAVGFLGSPKSNKLTPNNITNLWSFSTACLRDSLLLSFLPLTKYDLLLLVEYPALLNSFVSL